jgi:hypothetical protein
MLNFAKEKNAFREFYKSIPRVIFLLTSLYFLVCAFDLPGRVCNDNKECMATQFLFNFVFGIINLLVALNKGRNIILRIIGALVLFGYGMFFGLFSINSQERGMGTPLFFLFFMFVFISCGIIFLKSSYSSDKETLNKGA